MHNAQKHFIGVSGVKVFAVILAGGSGERFGSDLPKQFCKLAGREVIKYNV